MAFKTDNDESLYIDIPEETIKTYILPNGDRLIITVSDKSYNIIYPDKSCEFKSIDDKRENLINIAKSRAVRRLHLNSVDDLTESEPTTTQCALVDETFDDIDLDC